MARLSFRDRLFTPKVANAMMSPGGILLAGVGAAATILVGAPLALAAGVGAVAWGARVALAMPTNAERPQPNQLSEPWRSYAQQAQDAKKRFDGVVASVSPGPLRQRLETLSARLDDGVDESWRIARRGHEIVGAIGKIDTVAAQAELEDLRRSAANEGATAVAETAKALEAQIASAERLAALAQKSRDRLRLLDARFDELLARTVEVSVGSGDSEGLGADVDDLVTELETLRVAMEETDRAAGLPSPPPPS
jgi:HPt (histidine-containing phosphotransfer) domain-containing protein